MNEGSVGFFGYVSTLYVIKRVVLHCHNWEGHKDERAPQQASVLGGRQRAKRLEKT